MARTALMNVMVNAALKAGRVLARDFGEVANLQVSRKGPADFVSAADRRAERIIHEELAKARPKWGFLLEERGAVPGEDPQHRFIVDPLDGTTNFLHAIPLFAISIALESQGRLMAAVVFNPVADELFTAERGRGAYLNDHRLRVAQRRDIREAVVSTGIPHFGRGDHVRALAELKAVMPEVAGVRRTGAASVDLAWTAAGRLDGYWEHGLKPWDTAAGMLLVREAGGFATDATGGEGVFETGSVVAGNEIIHRDLLGLVGRATASLARVAAENGAS